MVMVYPEKYLRLAKRTAAYRALENAAKKDRLGQSYLFASPDTLLSSCVATAVACLDGDCGGCLECPRCRRIASGKCADVISLGGGGFKVEDADVVVGGCLVTPVELNKKYYVLDLTDANEAAQNKLLKTLEDAPECAIFFVVAPSRASVLPTVASRLETVVPVSDGLPEADDFSPYYSLAMYGGRDSLTEFDGLLSGEKAGCLTAALGFVTFAAADKKLQAVGRLPTSREEFRDTLGYIELIFGDIMKKQSGLPVETYGLYDIDGIAAAFLPERMPEALGEVRRAVRRVPTGNLASIADALIIKITEVGLCRR